MTLRPAIYAACCLHLCGCSPESATTPDAPAVDCPSEVRPAPGIVFTAQGPVRGVSSGSTYHYLGIPYAAPPVGELRWRPPSEPACHGQLLEASTLGEICPQQAMM